MLNTKILKNYYIGIILFIVGIILDFIGFFQSINNFIYDNFNSFLLNFKSQNENIVQIVVDKKTLESFGNQEYWTRSRYEGLLQEIIKQNPKIIYLDYYFSSKVRPENVDWSLLQQILGANDEQVDDIFNQYFDKIDDQNYISSIDLDFANLIENSKNIVFPYLFRVENGKITKKIQLKPLDIFEKNSLTGYINIIPDNDGVIRKVTLNNELGKHISEIISNAYLGKDVTISKDYFINYSNYPYKFKNSIQFINAYNGIFKNYEGENVDLNGKIVLIGDYDESFGDVRKTPLNKGVLMSGIEVLTNQISTLISGSMIYKIDGSLYYVALFFLFIYIFLLFNLGQTILFSSLILLFLISSITVFFLFLLYKNIYFELGVLFYLIVVFYLFFIFKISYSYFSQKTFIKKLFSFYVDKNIVENMISKQDETLNGIKKDICIVFCDIAKFTDFSEKLEIDKIVYILNKYFGASNSLVDKYGGIVNKYIGDAILTFFGYNSFKSKDGSFIEKHFVNDALNYALDLLNEINILKQNEPILTNLNIKIGINFGNAFIGNVGNERFRDYTIIGDCVNISSRLEGLNKYYNTSILISENVVDLMDNNFIIRQIDKVKLKGKNNPIKIYELIGKIEKGENIPTKLKMLIDNHHDALHKYFNKQFDLAYEIFEMNFLEFGDKVAKTFLERIEKLKNQDLQDWDGVYSFDKK